jgi:hypothetical protein
MHLIGNENRHNVIDALQLFRLTLPRISNER